MIGGVFTAVALATCLCFAGRREKRLALSTRACQIWCRACLRVMGIRTTVTGPLPPEGALLAPNHTGYADILAVGAACRCFFVPKAEVAHWPLVNVLVRLSHQVLTRRTAGRNIHAELAAVRDRLSLGHRVCIFLEGTSTGGDRVLPFRGALLEAAVECHAPVIPVAIRWGADEDGIDPAEDIAYWKDHVFGSHVWRLLGLRGVRGEVRFGEAIRPEDQDRRELARQVRGEVVRLCGLPQ